MRNAIVLLSIGFILGRLVPPLFQSEKRVQTTVASDTAAYDYEYLEAGVQIYDFRYRETGTNVAFTICAVAYSTDWCKVDIGKARLRTRLADRDWRGEWAYVERERRERVGEDAIRTTVWMPRQPLGLTREFQFVVEAEVEE